MQSSTYVRGSVHKFSDPMHQRGSAATGALRRLSVLKTTGGSPDFHTSNCYGARRGTMERERRRGGNTGRQAGVRMERRFLLLRAEKAEVIPTPTARQSPLEANYGFHPANHLSSVSVSAEPRCCCPPGRGGSVHEIRIPAPTNMPPGARGYLHFLTPLLTPLVSALSVFDWKGANFRDAS